MKIKAPRPRANFWIIAGTLTFFILSYFIYLEYYVPNKESEIKSTRFRALDQIGKNIKDKIVSYDKDVIALQLNNIIKERVDSINKLLESYGYYFTKNEIAAYVYKNIDLLNKDLEVFAYKLDEDGEKDTNERLDLEDNGFSKPNTDEYFYFKPTEIQIKDSADGNTRIFHDSFLVRIKYDTLLKEFTRKDLFDEMFILRNGEFIFSTLNSDMLIEKSKGKKGIFEFSFTNPQSTEPAESKESSKSGPEFSLLQHIISGEYADITISNTNYKLFFKPVKVEGEYWYLGGLMEAGNFSAASKSIPQRVIIFLSLVLILIILGLPVIKLKVISKTEHLRTGTIVNSALAILVGTSVLTIFLLYLSQNFSHLQNSNKQLIKLSAAVESSFTKEMDTAYRQLKKFDQDYESFNFDSISLVNKYRYIPDILNLPENHPAFPAIYPFVDYVIWAKTKGEYYAYLTTFKEKGLMVNIKNRDYFSKKDEWFFPIDSTKKFRLESIVSNTSGYKKLAISTRSENKYNPVIAITSQFYSLIDPIVPKNFGYCIIDTTGKVWFHSIKERNLMENFIRECNDDRFLKAALYNRTSTSMNVTYYNKPHQAFIQPLKQLPLYLITFYNRDNETSFQAQIFTMTSVFIFLFFMFIFLQVSILLMLERRYQWKLTKNLIMKITRPMAHLEEHYRFLFRVYMVAGIVTAIELSFIGKIQSFALIYIVEIIIFVFSYRVLNDNELKENQTKWFTVINAIILALINIGLAMWIDIGDVFMLLGYQLLLILLLYKVYRSFKRKLKQPESPDNQVFVRNYIMFLLSMSILFAILPTMAFNEISYNKESEIRMRHYQVDLMKKREYRNAKWNIYYAPFLDSPAATAILQDRKNRGIYINFYRDLTFSQTPIPPAEMEKNTIRNSISDWLVVWLRPIYDYEIVENKYLALSGQKNNYANWIEYGSDSLVYKYLSNTEDPKFEKQEYYRIAGKVEKLNFLIPFHGNGYANILGFVYNLFFWIGMLFILFISFYLIRFGIRNIYSLNIVANFSPQLFGELIRHQIHVYKNIFIVRLSPKDEIKALPDSIIIDLRLNWSDEEVIKMSESKINECLAKYKSNQKPDEVPGAVIKKIISGGAKKNDFVTIFINHFEWDYMNPEILKVKLETLLKFIQHQEIHLIIHSDENPAKILAYYREMVDLNKNTAQNDKNTIKVDLALYSKILNDLQRLMNNTIINHLPVKCSNPKEEKESLCGKQGKKLDPEGLIKKELNACDFLSQFKETMNAFYDSNIKGHNRKNPEEMIIDRINTLADSYYEDLFNSCSPEEQYVMYDLASDLIMNQKNSKAIFGLLEKGIFVKKCDKVSFMNVSFRRFVFSKHSLTGIADLEIKIGNKSGTWQAYRVMFILIIISLIIFIAMANQDLMKHINQIFMVIGGGIATITSVLGLLSRNNKSVPE